MSQTVADKHAHIISYTEFFIKDTLTWPVEELQFFILFVSTNISLQSWCFGTMIPISTACDKSVL